MLLFQYKYKTNKKLFKTKIFLNEKLIAPYSVSKTALIGMTKAMAPQCAELGIRVNCIGNIIYFII